MRLSKLSKLLKQAWSDYCRSWYSPYPDATEALRMEIRRMRRENQRLTNLAIEKMKENHELKLVIERYRRM